MVALWKRLQISSTEQLLCRFYCKFNKDNMEECDYFKLRNFISSRLDSGASYRILLISEMEVSNIFKSIASNKGTGHDGISPRILKECSSHLYSPLYKMNLTSKKLENFQR